MYSRVAQICKVSIVDTGGSYKEEGEGVKGDSGGGGWSAPTDILSECFISYM